MPYYDYDGNEIGLEEWALLHAMVTDDVVRWQVDFTEVGDVHISTVWIGIDYSFGRGRPLIFETMVFGGPLDEEQRRYATAEEAQKGHDEMVELVKLTSS